MLAVDLKELHAKIARLALENDFLAGALVLAKYGPPEMFNSNQGSQFTSEAFTEPLPAGHIFCST